MITHICGSAVLAPLIGRSIHGPIVRGLFSARSRLHTSSPGPLFASHAISLIWLLRNLASGGAWPFVSGHLSTWPYLLAVRARPSEYFDQFQKSEFSAKYTPSCVTPLPYRPGATPLPLGKTHPGWVAAASALGTVSGFTVGKRWALGPASSRWPSLLFPQNKIPSCER